MTAKVTLNVTTDTHLALYAILLSCVKTKDFENYLAQCDNM